MTELEFNGVEPSSATEAGATIVGIEFASNYVRGVMLESSDGESLITAVAEAEIISPVGHGPRGPFDSALVGPALDELIGLLNINISQPPQVAVSFGPSYAGVGSGPSLPPWLQQQASLLAESLICAGDLGVAFAPRSAVESVGEAVAASGLHLSRLDLAPVAAARVLDMMNVDTLTVGSGRGWQARLRDAEVLEALEVVSVDVDAPLLVIDENNDGQPVSAYFEVGLGANLVIDDPDLGQYAAAAGAALGLYYSSPADLLTGELIDRGGPRQVLETPDSTELSTPWGQRVAGATARTTLNLQRHPASGGLGSAFGHSLTHTEPIDLLDLGPEPQAVEPQLVDGDIELVDPDIETAEAEDIEIAEAEDIESAVEDATDGDLDPEISGDESDVEDVAVDDHETPVLEGEAASSERRLPVIDLRSHGGTNAANEPAGSETAGLSGQGVFADTDMADVGLLDGDGLIQAEDLGHDDPITQFSPDENQQQTLSKADGLLRNRVILLVLALVVVALLVYNFVLS